MSKWRRKVKNIYLPDTTTPTNCVVSYFGYDKDYIYHHHHHRGPSCHGHVWKTHKVCSFHLFKCWTSYHTDCICDNNHHSIISFSSLFFFFRVEKEVDFFFKILSHMFHMLDTSSIRLCNNPLLGTPLLRKRTREENMKNWQTNKKNDR